MKQSEKIMKLVKMLTETRESDLYGKDWEWVKNNTDFAEWYQDALTLERYIDALKPRWIPISERLPEDGELVLVRTDRGEIKLSSLSIWQESPFHSYAGRREWALVGSLYTVTHWMPLPELPEAQQ